MSMDFEASMKQLRTLSGTTQEELERISKDILALAEVELTCYSCCVAPRQSGSIYCKNCHQEWYDELQDFYDSQWSDQDLPLEETGEDYYE